MITSIGASDWGTKSKCTSRLSTGRECCTASQFSYAARCLIGRFRSETRQARLPDFDHILMTQNLAHQGLTVH